MAAEQVLTWDRAWFRRLADELTLLPHQPVEVQSAVRRALAADPVAFAMIYLGHHLRSPVEDNGPSVVSFSDVHFAWARMALSWKGSDPGPAEDRHAFIAPRSTGKTTWWFLILPLWAAANGVIRFAAAFAHSTGQAENHLSTLKHELDTNALLRADFPELCTPARRQSGGTIADRQGMLHTRSGFVFAAKGIDSQALGMKVGAQRPDLLILDDIEPDEASYSAAQAVKRLGTVTDAIFPLNIRARVIMVGTVTMPGSVMHQLVKAAAGVDVEAWISDEKITAHHHVPLIADDEGTERSIWPEKWPLSFLLSIRHTRSYAKNYLNDPLGADGPFWNSDDFTHTSLGIAATRWILSLDPAVTTKGTSDYTGWAVVGYDPLGKRVEIADAGAVKLVGEQLRMFVLGKLTQYERIKAVRVEVNQGGDLWYTVLHTLPVKLLVHTSKESKEVRFAWALDYYQTGGGRVVHRKQIRPLEEQMVSFPGAPFDDIADAAVAGILYFLRPGPVPVVPTATSTSYV